jgi:translation initiation factor 4E
LPFDHEKALLESSGDPNDNGEAFTVIKSDGKNNKGTNSAKKELSYREQLMSLGQISTVEHFFNYYVYMKRPSHMPREIDLFFFRDGETPMWEDSPNGGIWISKIRKDDDIDKMWETILFALIGEQFEEPLVIGASLSLRTKERLLQIWLKDGRNDQLRVNISNKLRQLLQLDPSATTLYYKEHQKSIIDKSTMKNAEGFKFLQQKKE